VTAAGVSIVIPTRNGGARFRSVLDAVTRQRVDVPIELIVIDSGSTDATVALAERHASSVIRVEPERFNHGTTRNLGIERSRGEFVVMLVQDAIPVGDDWLAALIEPLRHNDRLAGTFARQTPEPGASALTRHYLSEWLAAKAADRTVFLTPDEFDQSAPEERFDRCIFDNVCSCIRRDVWTRIPFRSSPIAEDLAWAREVLAAGFGLAYVPAAMVEHSHDRSALYELKRTWVLHQQLYALFGLRTIPAPANLVRAVASCLRLHYRLIAEARQGVRAQAKGAALAVAWPLGQYLGGWTAANRRDWRPKGV
jgi:rhamnosyltransferase